MNPAADHRLTVWIAHADPLLALGLSAVLAGQADLDVRLAGGGGGEPDAVQVLLADLPGALRHLAGLRCHAVPRALAGARVLVVGASDREHDVRRALEAGVHGYLPLGCGVDELGAAVHALGRGGRYLSMTVAQRMAESLAHEALTARETEVLALIVHGRCNKAIARELAIAVGTVKAHVKAIMAKLDATSRTHAASIASRRGLVGMPADGASDAPAAWGAPEQPALALQAA
ncbi:response regulator transcription factor [Aquincola sp. MAHUQ-54]|uniref:Response regulator transcription factor n=1 Tax=Aquincola agrisoli TaxID=3119538 RepID=A0AAW9QL72_9BURK